MLVDLEKELHHLKTARLEEERDELARERDEWKRRAEQASAGRPAGADALAWWAVSSSNDAVPPPPDTKPRARPLVSSRPPKEGGWPDEDEGADDVVDLADAKCGDDRLGNVARKVQRRPAGDGDEKERRCAVSHALLNNCDLTDGAAPTLRLFVGAQRLRVLDLEDNCLGPAALSAVADAIKDDTGASGTRLQRLCLSNNLFGGSANCGDALGDALAKASKDGFLPRLFELTVTLSDDHAPPPMRLGARTPGHALGDNPILPADPNDHYAPPPPPPPPTRDARKKEGARRGVSKAPPAKKKAPGAKPQNAFRFLRKIAVDDAAPEARKASRDGGRPAPQLGALSALSLRGAQLSPDSAKLLGRLRRLTSLDVSFGFLGPSGCADLARSLVAGPDPRDPAAAGLTYLDLRHNAVGDAGVLALAAALDGSSASKPPPGGYYDLAVDKRARDDDARTARRLDLPHDEMENAAPSARDAFARARTPPPRGSRPRSPVKRGLGGRVSSTKPGRITEKPPKAPEKHRRGPPPRRAPAMTYLDLSANRVSARGARALALALKRSKTLACVDVGRNDFGADACAALLRAAAASPGFLELRGARRAGARASDTAAFSRAVADRRSTSRRTLAGAPRTVTIRDPLDDAGIAVPDVFAAAPDATLRFAAGAGPLAAKPPVEL